MNYTKFIKLILFATLSLTNMNGMKPELKENTNQSIFSIEAKNENFKDLSYSIKQSIKESIVRNNIPVKFKETRKVNPHYKSQLRQYVNKAIVGAKEKNCGYITIDVQCKEEIADYLLISISANILNITNIEKFKNKFAKLCIYPSTLLKIKDLLETGYKKDFVKKQLYIKRELESFLQEQAEYGLQNIKDMQNIFND